MGGTSPLFATQTPTPNAIPISDGSGSLRDWIGASETPAPGAIPIADGSGLLDAWITPPTPGGGGAYVPVTTGAEPAELVSDGAGNLILTPYTP